MDSFLKQYCSKEWIDFIEFHKSVYTLQKDNLVFKEGDDVKGLFIINKGKIKVFSNESTGKEKIFRLAGEGEILGHRGFGGDWVYPVSAKTYEETTLSFIPLNIFNLLAKTNIEITYQLMMFFAEELRNSETKINHLQVKNRVARAILYNYTIFGADKKDPQLLSFTIPRKDYASLTNTTYESIIRVLKELNDEKIIQSSGKNIKILDFNALESLANQ